MPSALETLVKILKLERERGYNNSAVIGGLSGFGENWKAEAHQQARRPEHHLLVDELIQLLSRYDEADDRVKRHESVQYMLDRIMGRVEPPPEFQITVPPPDTDPSVEQVVDAVEIDREDPVSAQQTESTATDTQSQNDPARRNDDVPVRTSDSNRHAHRPQRERKSQVVTKTDLPTQPRLARAPHRPRPVVASDEAERSWNSLNESATTVKGVGGRMAKSLDKLGVATVADLLFRFPRRYDDYTRLLPISRLQPNIVTTIIGTVTKTEVRVGRGARKDFFMAVDDGSGEITVMFFGQHFLVRTIRRGMQVVLSGATSIFGHQLQMTNPEWERLDSDHLHTIGIVPVYALTEGLSARVFRRMMKGVVEEWSENLPDYIPEATLDRAELGDLGWALKNIHFPDGWDHLEHARKRFIFDELLILQLAILGNRREWQSQQGQPLEIVADFLDNYIDSVFPYKLTDAQRRVIEDIRRDVTTDKPMNRLLQGDVGAGKTAVAITALGMALSNNKQAAFMAPTSILAEQHYRNVTSALEQMPGEQLPVIALLTSALTKSERESIYRGLADGSIDIAIGTHALIQPDVEFRDLALVIVDEQHRFGVEQRGQLRGKGTNPHLLVMTATPIPRTLALTIYADLDLSIIDEMPPGRIPVQTRVLDPVARERSYQFIESQLEEGRQAFVVHPLVEVSEQIDARSAMETYEHLQQVFHRFRVGLLHGRMKPAEKDGIMSAFSAGDFDVLVTTSVAEVGVDVPNASIIVIDGANRFGLAQLHQFRGRVGRGTHTSFCLLIAEDNSKDARERLQAMEETTDGFRLAEIDWKLRGPGDLLGTRQSGNHELRLVELMSPKLVELAQREARTIYEEDPELTKPEHHLLAQRVAMLHNDDSDLS